MSLVILGSKIESSPAYATRLKEKQAEVKETVKTRITKKKLNTVLTGGYSIPWWNKQNKI